MFQGISNILKTAFAGLFIGIGYGLSRVARFYIWLSGKCINVSDNILGY